MPNKPRAATPADAKAVWDSIVAKDGKPTVRGVAAALMASGQFLPITYGPIQRWKKNGWKRPGDKANLRAPALVEAAAKVDTAVPVLTGKATTRAQDLAGKPSAPKPGEGDAPPPTGEAGPPIDPATAVLRQALTVLSDDQLIKRAAREAYITAIILLKRMQERPQLVEEMPREIGSLQEALAGSLTAANNGFSTLLDLTDRMMKTVPNGDAPPAPAADPLDTALDEYAKAAAREPG